MVRRGYHQEVLQLQYSTSIEWAQMRLSLADADKRQVWGSFPLKEPWQTSQLGNPSAEGWECGAVRNFLCYSAGLYVSECKCNRTKNELTRTIRIRSFDSLYSRTGNSRNLVVIRSYRIQYDLGMAQDCNPARHSPQCYVRSLCTLSKIPNSLGPS